MIQPEEAGSLFQSLTCMRGKWYQVPPQLQLAWAKILGDHTAKEGKPSIFLSVQEKPSSPLSCLFFLASPSLSHLLRARASDTRCAGLPPPKPISPTPAGCPTSELGSDAVYLEAASDPTR